MNSYYKQYVISKVMYTGEIEIKYTDVNNMILCLETLKTSVYNRLINIGNKDVIQCTRYERKIKTMNRSRINFIEQTQLKVYGISVK